MCATYSAHLRLRLAYEPTAKRPVKRFKLRLMLELQKIPPGLGFKKTGDLCHADPVLSVVPFPFRGRARAASDVAVAFQILPAASNQRRNRRRALRRRASAARPELSTSW